MRCRGCGTWLCERCAHELADRPFCSRRCQLRETRVRALDTLAGIAVRPVHPAWTVTAVAFLVAVASVSLTPPLGRFLAAVGDAGAPPTPPAPGLAAVAALQPTADGWRLEVEGPPGSAVLVIDRGAPLAVVSLDDTGRAEASLHLPPAPAPDLRIVPLPGAGIGVPVVDDRATPGLSSAPATPPTVSAAPTATVAATATPTVTATKTPTATATATAVVTAIATATATSVPEVSDEAGPIVVVPLPVYRPPSPTATPRPTATPPAAPRRRPDRGAAPPVLHLVPDAGSRIALTFDGGATSSHAAELLDTLAELDLRVTLFLTGQFIEREPALVRRAVLAGHEVGNHTWSHAHLTSYADNRRHDLLPSVTRSWFVDQLHRTEAAFQAATGHPMAPLWRAPYGEENRTLRSWALAEGYLHVRWSTLEGASLDSRDWVANEHSEMYMDSRTMVTRLLQFPQLEGGIVLMHLSTERSEPAWTELPRFVSSLRRRGIRPVQVSELLEASPLWRRWLARAAGVDR